MEHRKDPGVSGKTMKTIALYFIAGANMGWATIGLILGRPPETVVIPLAVGLFCAFIIFRRINGQQQ